MREESNRNVKVDIEEALSRDIVVAVRDGRAALGVLWDTADFDGLQRRAYRRDQLALAVHAGHPLAGRDSIALREALDEEHVGLQSNSAVHRMLQRAAAQAGGSLDYRVIVSNFDAAFRAVAAGLGVSVIPMQVGSAYTAFADVKLVPLTDDWASRRFAVCFRDQALLQPAALRMLDYLAARAEG